MCLLRSILFFIIIAFTMPAFFVKSRANTKSAIFIYTAAMFLHMNTARINVHNNPNIGIYGLATDEYCLVGASITLEQVKDIEKALEVPVHQIKIAGTDLIGVFCAANKNCLLVPGIAFEEELKELDKLKINYKVIKTHLTALGNNILCNNNGALVNPEFSAVIKKEIRKALGVKVVPGTIGELETTGSCGICNKNGILISEEINDAELEMVQSLLNNHVFNGTVNESPLVRSGLIVNSKGYIYGSIFMRDEIFVIQEALFGEK